MRDTGAFVIFYFLFSILIFFLDTRGLFAPLHSLVGTTTIPIKSRLYQVKRALLLPFNAARFYSGGEQKLQELEQQNANLLARIVQLQAVEGENKNLRRLLGSNVAPSAKFTPAKIVLVEGDTAVLTSDYVPEKGVAVVTAFSVENQGSQNPAILVGRVEAVVGQQIKVTLLTSDNSKIPVAVQEGGGQQRASGLLVGRGSRVVLDQVLTSETLQENDLVFTSGGDGLPPDLLIGKVSKVLPAGAWQQAEAELAAEMEVLDTVFFVTKH